MGDSTATTCTGTTKRGTPCQNPALPGEAWCWWHHPDKADARKLARSKGGKARHGRRLGDVGQGEYIEIGELGDVVGVLERELNALLSLEKSISRARAVGYLASVLSSIYKDSELEQRLAALEAQAGTGR